MLKVAPLEPFHMLRGDSASLERISNSAIPEVVEASALSSPIKDFYLTNPIARASRTMHQLSQIKNAQTSQNPFITAAE